jgi:hypothetical protein
MITIGLDRFNLFEDVLGFGFGKDVAVVLVE